MTQTFARSGLTACLALAATIGTAMPARAQDDTAGMPGEWLSHYSTARTLGLGGAYVAAADDPLGVLWNPAGLSAMNQNEMRFESAKLFEGTTLNGFGFAVPGSWLPSLGVTMVSLRSGDFDRTNEMNDALGSFHEGESAYLFTIAKTFSPQLAIGTNVKYVQQTVEDFNAGGFGVDAGAWYQVARDVRIAASISNISGPSLKLRNTAETYPMQVRGGVSARLLNGRGLISAQIDHSDGLGTTLHGGGELWIESHLALRMGFDDAYGTGGFTYRVGPQYALDYGVTDQPLGMTHRLGVSYRFGGFFASSKAEPEIFSPTGEHATTRISLNSRTKSDPDTWTLEVINKSDEVVRRFSGKGPTPSHVEWDGKNEVGLPLADGTYRYRLEVVDHVGRRLAAPMRTLEISTTGPQGTVPVIPVQGVPTDSTQQTDQQPESTEEPR